jgi:hypothetical protein
MINGNLVPATRAVHWREAAVRSGTQGADSFRGRAGPARAGGAVFHYPFVGPPVSAAHAARPLLSDSVRVQAESEFLRKVLRTCKGMGRTAATTYTTGSVFPDTFGVASAYQTTVVSGFDKVATAHMGNAEGWSVYRWGSDYRGVRARAEYVAIRDSVELETLSSDCAVLSEGTDTERVRTAACHADTAQPVGERMDSTSAATYPVASGDRHRSGHGRPAIPWNQLPEHADPAMAAGTTATHATGAERGAGRSAHATDAAHATCRRTATVRRWTILEGVRL